MKYWPPNRYASNITPRYKLLNVNRNLFDNWATYIESACSLGESAGSV